MSEPTQSDIGRYQCANLRIIEAKAQLWATASFVVVLAVIVGLALLVAMGFKLVLG